ncbi:capsular biosynthesis protein [Rhizobium puerariae]|uniref:Capsular biosynthesis protein n=1 Tax=Rhizobium puerariae TaxID=1585791 RepID=A0ABV6A9E3_9HYPH
MAKDWYPSPGMRLGATIYVTRSAPWLKHYFGIGELESAFAPGIRGVVFWGGRSTARLARRIAWFRRLPYWYLEDGYLRSVGLGKEKTLPISIIVDDLGMPVDVSRASRLERLIAASVDMDVAGLGAGIREALIASGLSKYNNLPHREPRLDRTTRRRVLLVDQVFGDVSVPMSGGSPESFARMLEDAVASGVQCVVRTHPDVMAGFRKGYLTEKAAQTPGVVLLADAVSVASVLDVVDEVWTVSSQFGLDALLRGIPVRCYGAPFYSGWGLTDDRLGDASREALPRRLARPSVDQLTAATFSLYPSYRNTESWEEIDVFEAIDMLVMERRALDLD